tara:strand:- start:1914 stop:2252 length:339 start_codon:yes stop_codon:yes gene_type:complete
MLHEQPIGSIPKPAISGEDILYGEVLSEYDNVYSIRLEDDQYVISAIATDALDDELHGYFFPIIRHDDGGYTIGNQRAIHKKIVLVSPSDSLVLINQMPYTWLYVSKKEEQC